MSSAAFKFYATIQEYGSDEAITEGKAWYPNAWKECQRIGKMSNLTPERVAAIVSITSPRARWSVNVSAAMMIAMDASVPEFKRRKSYGILDANARKAVLASEDRYYSRLVTGPKVTDFYLNILGHTEPVTVDSLMSKCAGYGGSVTKRIRDEVTAGCRSIADVFDITPRDAQAAVWIAFRGGAS